jgi:outer membrane immunogenic protein
MVSSAIEAPNVFEHAEIKRIKLMKTLSAVVIAAGLVVAAAGHTQAADLAAKPYYKAPPVVAYLPWNKCYVGVTVGYTTTDSDPLIRATEPVLQNSIDIGNVPSYLRRTATGYKNPDGVIGGGTIGCNRQFDRIVVGAEADLSGTSIRDTFSVTQGGAVVTTTFTQKLDVLGTVRGRLGYAIDNTLLYATGGLAYAHLKGDITISSAAGLLAGSQDEWKGGWTVGGGLEHMFTQNWSVKGEYLYYDLGTSNIGISTVTGPIEAGILSYQNKGHIIRAGLNYHF